MIYDKARVNEPGYYDQFELCYKPALEKDRKDAERYRWLRNSEWVPFNEEWIGVMGILDRRDLDRTIDAEMWLTTKPLLVAPPVTKGKAESNKGLKDSFDKIFYKEMLNQVVDDYDLTSNDTRRGD